MRRPRTILWVALLCAAMLATMAAPVVAHPERPVDQSDEGVFPSRRDDGPMVVVCKPDSGERLATLPPVLRVRNEALLEQCRFEHVQAAVDHLAAEGRAGTRIMILPGVYREEPSRAAHERF